jgi:hypothetical protein
MSRYRDSVESVPLLVIYEKNISSQLEPDPLPMYLMAQDSCGPGRFLTALTRSL